MNPAHYWRALSMLVLGSLATGSPAGYIRARSSLEQGCGDTMKHSEETKRLLSSLAKARFSDKRNHPFFGMHHSDETKRKISLTKLALYRSGKLVTWNKGKKCPQFAGSNHPLYGRGHTLLSRMRMSASHLGLTCSLEQRRKLSLSRSGVKHWNWKGGKYCYSVGFSALLREEIRSKFDRRCVLCFGFEAGRKLDVHHIDYNRLNNSPENLVPLHQVCHVRTNYDRDFWVGYFGRIWKTFQTFMLSQKCESLKFQLPLGTGITGGREYESNTRI